MNKLSQFLHSALARIIDSTNKIYNLEDDLMPFLQKGDKRSNFKIDEQFPWIMTAKTEIQEIIDENIKGPLALLEKYK